VAANVVFPAGELNAPQIPQLDLWGHLEVEETEKKRGKMGEKKGKKRKGGKIPHPQIHFWLRP